MRPVPGGGVVAVGEQPVDLALVDTVQQPDQGVRGGRAVGGAQQVEELGQGADPRAAGKIPAIRGSSWRSSIRRWVSSRAASSSTA
ncbi:hypothetical protein ACFQ1I_14655 [Kitasatospora arboriphila]